MTTRIVELRRGVLKKNDELAALLRARFSAARVLVLNLVSSPGAGKTALLQAALTQLRARGLRAAALVGDLETDNDARRLALSGAPVRQINTHGVCHLDAEMVGKHLDAWAAAAPAPGPAASEPPASAANRAPTALQLAALDFLFIENVGNLVCPSSYDLGETLRVVLMSVTEGEDKPLKYPGLFNSADAAVLTKIDLAQPCAFDRALALRNLAEVRPGIPVFETSAKTGAGIDAWLAYLAAARPAREAARA
jgi:hydrogenase nickel incorporation protein HypB